ncbi:MAG: hypothetical protein IIY94_08485 [Oscillospiraceae bacterium]|nr:hypothetical protein [Oscillospiraceae bacterium]
MTANVTLQLEDEQRALYHITLRTPHGTCTLAFSVTPKGALGFDNRQANARVCMERRLSRVLAAEMIRTARERVPGALCGRTPRGLAFELRAHYRAYRLGILRIHSVTAEMGATDPHAPDHDSNAAWFEHPVRGLPSTLRALFASRRPIP